MENRKNWFYLVFERKGLCINTVAEKMNMKRDTLYRKIVGRNGFDENDIKKLLGVLDMSFEEVFYTKNI